MLIHILKHPRKRLTGSRNVFFQKTLMLPHTWNTSLGGVLSPKFTRKYRRIKDWKNFLPTIRSLNICQTVNLLFVNYQPKVKEGACQLRSHLNWQNCLNCNLSLHKTKTFVVKTLSDYLFLTVHNSFIFCTNMAQVDCIGKWHFDVVSESV